MRCRVGSRRVGIFDHQRRREVECIDFLINLRNVLCGCDSYQEEDCATPFHVYLDGNYFGSVCLFVDVRVKDPQRNGRRSPTMQLIDEYTMFQGITKSLAHSLISYFYPERATTVKLNSVLIPALEEYCREKGVSKLYVAPVGRQGSILSKWYGFVECPPITSFPCSVILGSPESHASAANFYVKYL